MIHLHAKQNKNEFGFKKKFLIFNPLKPKLENVCQS